MILVKVHENGVVAICDKSLLGQTISSKELEVTVSDHFYGGTEKTENELLSLIKNSRNVNLIGCESVDFALEHNLIKKSNIINVDNVPMAQIIEVDV